MHMSRPSGKTFPKQQSLDTQSAQQAAEPIFVSFCEEVSRSILLKLL